MFGLIVLAALALAVLAVLGLLAAVASLVLWVVFLPFKLLAFVFKGIAALLVAPFLLLLGGVLILAIGFPVLLLCLIPVVPVVLLFAGIVWLARRGMGRSAAASR